jgi:hypothetical protein
MDPNPLLFLEISQLVKTIEKQNSGEHRGQDAEGTQPFADGGADTNEQGKRQSPKQRGEPSHQPS